MRAALSARAQLHEPDCVHWCEGSEATQLMASAVLNMLRATMQAALAPGAPGAGASAPKPKRFVKTVRNATKAAARARAAGCTAGAGRQNKAAFHRFGEWKG